MYVIRRPIVRNSRESLIITFLASSLYNIIREKSLFVWPLSISPLLPDTHFSNEWMSRLKLQYILITNISLTNVASLLLCSVKN